MSVLHRRIMGQAGYGYASPGHPAATPETPMVMAANEHTYANGVALYGQLHPLVTPDGAVIASRSQARVEAPWVGAVVPAGRP